MNDFDKKFERIVAEYIGDIALDYEANIFTEYGIDIVDLIQIIDSVEDALYISIPDSEIHNINTLEHLKTIAHKQVR